MSTKISRRAFLRLLSAAGLTGLGFRPFSGEDSNTTANDIGRVTVRSVSVYAKPSDKSQILFQRYRDELINIYYEVNAEEGPAYNPIWYRVWGGYMHRANVVRSRITYNPVASNVPETGQLAEVTVPFTQAMRFTGSQGWETLYRLYNSSTHWVHAVEEGPDGEPWYKLIDELLGVDYHVPAMHLRLIQPEEFTPITPEVPQHKKHIEVVIGHQKVICYENDVPVMETSVSTGLDYSPPNGEMPWNTPKGTFYIFSKMPSKHMGDGRLSGNPEDYELPGVPWTTFFETSGVAFHGTYWHEDFGTPRSHGCVNMRSEEAKWLFRWVMPANDPETVEQRGWGTRVVVS